MSDVMVDREVVVTFLSSIFGELPQGECVLLARALEGGGFQHTKAGSRNADKWLERGEALYFNISTVIDQTPLRRRSQDCRAAYCMVLDDVGVKVDVPSIEPSWILETSAGSFQYGYILAQPCEDLELFAQMMRDASSAQATDGGCIGHNRLMRVPGSVNKKPGRDMYVSRLVMFDKDRMF